MTKNIQIILPNSNIINTAIEEDDGALFIYKKIQEVNPGFTPENIKLKKDLNEDDIKLGEKEYDFGRIREGERFLTFIIEPSYEKLEEVVYITRLAGLNINSSEYIQSCRYHFRIINPIYQTTNSFSILYDFDFKKFALEPKFHKGNWSVIIDLKPFMSSRRPIFNDQSGWSINYNTKWHNTLKELLESVSLNENEEGSETYHLSQESIENIEQLYEKHKLRFYN